MAQLLLEPFIGYALSDITQIWNQIDLGTQGSDSFATSLAPRAGSQYLKLSLTTGGVGNTGNTYRIVPAFPAVSGNVAIAGIRFYASSWSALASNGTTTICKWLRSGTEQCKLVSNSDGTLSVVRGSTVLGTTSAAFSNAIWDQIQVKITIHPSAGTIDIVRGGLTSLLSLTGVNTANSGSAGWTEFALGPIKGPDSTGPYLLVMDLFLADGSGSSWNDFMGDVRLDLRHVTAEGAHTDSTPSTGSDRAATVDETTMNGDTDYNTFDTIGQVDTYVVEDAAVATAEILGIEIRSQTRKEDAGAAGIKLCAVINGTLYEGIESAITTSYSVIRESLGSGINPDTSAAWTDTGASGFNASEFGVKKSS